MEKTKSPPVVVPSDVTICENLYSTGTRELTSMEKLGLLLTPNPIRFNYTKNDRFELQSVLSKKYSDDPDYITDILLTRQKSISKQVTFNYYSLHIVLKYILNFRFRRRCLVYLDFWALQ